MDSIYIDYNQSKEQLIHQLNSLSPVPGTCVFIDMCNSTALKNINYIQWIIMIKNTFQIAQSYDTFYGNIIKHIGDEIMIYIPDDKLVNNTHVDIFNDVRETITRFQNVIGRSTLRLKAAIHYCKDVYNISFLKGRNDYYGTGIDLTARLMKDLEENYINISEEFWNKLDINFINNNNISFEHDNDKFKGIKGTVNFVKCHINQ